METIWPKAGDRCYLGVVRNTALIMLGLALLGGCQFKGADVARRGGSAGAWPFGPASVRVHPFTSLKLSGNGSGGSGLLDAHVEMLDVEGDVTKGVGEMRFELYAEAYAEAGHGTGRRLHQWQASIATIEDNRHHWDPITRTYRFPLQLHALPPRGQRLVLHVQFDSADGQRLMADAVIEPRER